MKIKFAILLGAAALLSPVQRGFTADANPELNTLVTQLNADIKAGKRTEADLSDDFKQFDVLLAEHKGEKTDAVANILYQKARLYFNLFEDNEKTKALMNQVKTDFPGTKSAAEADKALAKVQKDEEAKKNYAALVVGTKFPGFNEVDIDGKPLSIADHKGKVVLIDFWATWCVPCRAELPNVLLVYGKYHDKGFDVIGVNLDEAKDKDKLLDFIKYTNMKWQQFFDGKGWDNKLVVKYGIEGIPDYIKEKPV